MVNEKYQFQQFAKEFCLRLIMRAMRAAMLDDIKNKCNINCLVIYKRKQIKMTV